MGHSPGDGDQGPAAEEDRDARYWVEAAVAPGIGLDQLDSSVRALGHGIGDAVLRVGQESWKMGFRAFAAVMIGGRREWVVQKYRRSKNVFAEAA